MEDRRLVGTMAAAREVGVHYGTLSRWANDGFVKPAERTAGGPTGRGHWRWDVDDLRRQLRANDEAAAVDPIRAAYTAARAIVDGMPDLHAALAIVVKIVAALRELLGDATDHQSELVARIYEQDALALKPLADQVSISQARAQREGQ